MRDLNVIMDRIDSKKPIIAKAISLAFSDGDLTKAQAIYPYILKAIMATHVGVIKTNDHSKTNYDREIDAMLDEMSKHLDFDAKKVYYSDPIHFAFNPLESKSAKEFDVNLEKKLNKAYLSGVKIFLKLGISYESFVKLYKERGAEVFEISKTAKLLQRKLILSTWKRAYSLEKEKFDVKEFVSQFGDVINEYNVTSIEDLMNLYTEISSVLIDDSNLSEEEKKIIEENKMKLYRRTGTYLDNKEDLVYLKKRIEDMYANYSMGKCLRESNMDELISRFGLKLDKQVFRHFVSFYGYVHGVDGFNNFTKINDEYINFTFLHDSVFERYNESQDMMIIHELIHSVEPLVENVKPFDVECKSLNEALTEYFTKEAYKYIEHNIVEDIIDKEGTIYCSVYDCMMPLVYILKDSPLWCDVVHCKRVNDYTLLKERVPGYATKISKIFDEVFSKSRKGELNHKTFILYKAELAKLIVEIQEKYPRYNKKTVI